MASTYGIKVSKPGVNVGTADGQELVLFSSYNSPKIVQEGVGTVSVTGTAFSATLIPHSLGYVPGYDVWATLGTLNEWYPSVGGAETGPGTNITYYTEVNTTDLTIYARLEGGGSDNLIYHYYIYVDPGA